MLKGFLFFAKNISLFTQNNSRLIVVGGLDTMKTAFVHKHIFNVNETVTPKYIDYHNT